MQVTTTKTGKSPPTAAAISMRNLLLLFFLIHYLSDSISQIENMWNLDEYHGNYTKFYFSIKSAGSQYIVSNPFSGSHSCNLKYRINEPARSRLFGTWEQRITALCLNSLLASNQTDITINSLYFTQSLSSAKNSHFPLIFWTQGSFQGFQLVVSELTCLGYIGAFEYSLWT